MLTPSFLGWPLWTLQIAVLDQPLLQQPNDHARDAPAVVVLGCVAKGHFDLLRQTNVQHRIPLHRAHCNTNGVQDQRPGLAGSTRTFPIPVPSPRTNARTVAGSNRSSPTIRIQ